MPEVSKRGKPKSAPAGGKASREVPQNFAPWSQLGIIAVAVTIIVVWVHWPALSAQAISFDDEEYLLKNTVVQNPSWTYAGRFLGEILTPSTVRGYYQPLAMISLMLDSAMGGRPDYLMPFHRTSLALHVANTVLIIVLLYLLFDNLWIATMIGLLFGVHPMTVEPIAWVGDRKTTLAAFFALISLIAYVRYARGARDGGRGTREKLSTKHSALSTWTWYALCIVCYVLASMSKPTSTLLPMMLLVMDFWPLGRLSRRTIVEKVPFFAVSGLSAVITVVSQGRTAGAAPPTEHSVIPILLGLCHNIVFYLHKMVYPVHLSSFYPQPDPMSLSQGAVLAGVIGTCVLLTILLVSLRWTRVLLAGWLMFFAVILPTMGGIGFTYVIAADKYAYLPAVGLLISLAWYLGKLWSANTNARVVRAGMCAVVLAVAVGEGIATRRYLDVWQDSERLHEHMLKLAPRAWQLHYNLGLACFEKGKLDDAIRYYRQALELKPDRAEAYSNLGAAFAKQGRTQEAIAQYRQALKLNPGYVEARNNLGAALIAGGQAEDAIAQYRQAIEKNPNYAEARFNLGIALAGQGKTDQAIEQYRQAVRLKPDHVQARYYLGNALAGQGHTEEAIEEYRQVLRYNPNDAEAQNNLGAALIQAGQADEAITHFREAIRLNPDHVNAHKNLARVFAYFNKNEQATQEYREILRVQPQNANVHCDLGELLSKMGRNDEALRAYREALRIDPNHQAAHQLLQAAMSQPTDVSPPTRK